MNLYTILINFEDRTTWIGQYCSNTPEDALFEFIQKSESLYKYDRNKLFEVLKKRQKLTIHITNMKWFWIIDFWIDLLNIRDFSSIFGWYIIQSDQRWPIRN